MIRQIIITRAQPGARETEARLRRLGYDTLILPALEIRGRSAAGFTPPDADDTYIFTSANGVRAIADAGWPMERKAVCVGPATLSAAQAAGVSDAVSADGNADDLFDFIMAMPTGDRPRHFVHVANADAAGNLVARLRETGQSAEFVPLYEAAAVSWEPIAPIWQAEVAADALILIHSARGAQSVHAWIEAGDVETTDMALAGVSDRAIGPLSELSFAARVVAMRPNEEELITALQTIAEPGVSSGKQIKREK